MCSSLFQERVHRYFKSQRSLIGTTFDPFSPPHFRRQESALQTDQHSGCQSGPAGKQKTRKWSKTQVLKERIRQFSMWYVEETDKKERDHFQLRLDRRRRRKDKNTKWMGLVKALFMLDVMAWVTGMIMTVCSTVGAIGKDTVFYENKDFYRILGPVIILVAVIILLVVAALNQRFRSRNRITWRAPHIMKSERNKKDKNGQETSNPVLFDLVNESDSDIVSNATNRTTPSIPNQKPSV